MSVATVPISEKAFKGEVEPDWCPGCGDFSVLKALMLASSQEQIAPHDLMVVSGIGCSSNLPGFIHSYGVHSLHGRALPIATGIKFANQDLTVVVTGGDGDGYGIGLGHFIHAMRRNIDITYLVMNNQIYGLTTGQVSPTSEEGMKTKTTPKGSIEVRINPMSLALSSGATYIARGFSGDQKQLAKLFRDGIAHKGFALIDVFSPCVTYNKVNTYPWFKANVYKLEDKGHDCSDWTAAMARAMEWGDKEIPIGLFFKTERPTYQDRDAIFAKGALVKQPVSVSEELGAEIIADSM